MDNIFHQTDETFYETQYSRGFPNHPSGAGSNTTRPASANDGGLQMKRLLENERTKPKEQQYRERWHQMHRSQNEPIGGQKFLHTVDSMNSIKDRTHGAKSKVESNFSNILFPGYDANRDKMCSGSDDGGDAARSMMMTHGKRTNSDRNGGCLWKIFNHEASSSSLAPPPPPSSARKDAANLPPAGKRLERCPSAPCRRYDMITQEAEHQDAPAINKALQYLHKLRSLLSRSGAVQCTRKELEQAVLLDDGTEKNSCDWNGVLLKYIGAVGALDYGVLKPLLSKLTIDTGSYGGFVRFLDLLDSEVSLAQFELGKHMQQESLFDEKEGKEE
uniref:Uncharacterized protein n=1 Tax=Anopheles maculatus TaxID=74869 RepID=A0A182SG61_9DIPT